MSIKEYMKSRIASRQTIYNRMEKGLLKTVKDGNKIYIVKEFSNSRKISKINSADWASSVSKISHLL